MSSTYSRGQIVTDALALAGRSSELNAACRQWLNYFLQHIGLTFRFPELRKVGSVQQLSMGTPLASLPTDFGAGMELQGMIFGSDNKPLSEVSYEDFASTNGFQPTTGTGRPYFYLIDREAGVFRFSTNADQAYSFFPVYFKKPPLLSTDSSDDSKSIWLDNDLLAVEGLMWFIYKFTSDERENSQQMKVEKMINDWKREVVKMGGTGRVQPNPSKFKTIKFGGFQGP